MTGLALVAAPSSQAAPVDQTAAAVEQPLPVKGQTHVHGWTKSECETKGGRVARKKMNQGYTVTFVGCSYDGLADEPWNGTVFWRLK